MSKSANKTSATDASVAAYLAGLADPERIADCRTLVAMMRKASGEKPRMWGPTMIGFGSYHYTYDSGREGDSFIVGFAPRKGDTSIYIVPGFADYQDLLAKIGKHKVGKVCLYVKRLADVDLVILQQLIERSVADMRTRYR